MTRSRRADRLDFASATTTKEGPMTSTEEITALFDRLVAAWNVGDIAGVTAQFAADGRLVSPFGHDARGTEAVQDLYQQFLGDGPLKGSQTTVRIEDVRLLADDIAVVDCNQIIDECDLGRLDLHLVKVLHRGPDGWRALEARPYAFLPLPVAAA